MFLLQSLLSGVCTLLGLWIVLGNAMMPLTRTDPQNGRPIHLQTKRQLSLTCSGRHNVKAKLSELRGEGLKMAGEGFSKGFKRTSAFAPKT